MESVVKNSQFTDQFTTCHKVYKHMPPTTRDLTRSVFGCIANFGDLSHMMHSPHLSSNSWRSIFKLSGTAHLFPPSGGVESGILFSRHGGWGLGVGGAAICRNKQSTALSPLVQVVRKVSQAIMAGVR